MFKLLVFWMAILITSANHAAVPQVVVTIKPIHSLVSGVMEGVDTPYLLLSGGESPHHYSLRPSQVRQLHRAAVVIWVAPTVETFLEKVVATLGDKTRILRLIEVPGLNLLKVREGKTWETHHHDSGFEIDSHIWLSPDNAKVIVQAVARTLSLADANNAARYAANAVRLVERLEQLDQALKQQLAPVKELPYLVFHDAYQYFEHHYGLTAVGAVALSPESRPSVRRLYQLRASMKKQQIRCVFSEPQFEPALVATLIEGTSVRRGVLDPLGADLPVGVEGYFTLLGNLAESLRRCLQTAG